MTLRTNGLYLFPLFFAIPCLGGWLSAQTIYTKVIDHQTGEGLPGSYLSIPPYGVLSANEFGQASLTLSEPTETLDITVSFLGFQTLDTTVRISAGKNNRFVFGLRPDNTLPTVTILGNDVNTEGVHSSLNRIAPSIETLRKLPALGGEADILKALQLSPGISGGAEGTADLLVRGGTPDQNLILLDGAKVYNSNHLFGLLSPFQPSLVKGIEVFKGGFPARYGGRLSSVVNVTSLEGRQDEWNGEATAGIINAQVSANGPVTKNISLSLGARTAYLSLLNLILDQEATFQTYAFYDVNAKATLRTDRSNLSFSAFRNHDVSSLSDDFLRTPTTGRLNYGNAAVGGRWLYNMFGTFNILTEVNANTYRFLTEQETLTEGGEVIDALSSTSTIREITGRIETTGRISPKISLTAGVEKNSRRIDPRDIEGTVIEAGDSFATENSGDVGYYIEPVFRIGPRVDARIGLRYQVYELAFTDDTDAFLEPRLAVNAELTENTLLSASYARMSQGIHMITNNFVGIPNNLWVSGRQAAPPSLSDTYTIGASTKIRKTTLAIETFYRNLYDLIDPLPGTNLFQNSATDWVQTVSTAGEARVYGAEVNWSIDRERWNFGLAYTLAWNRIRYDEVNNGEWYFRQFDRRHDIALTGAYEFNDRWSLFANFVFNDGYRLSLPKTVYYDGLFDTTVPFYSGRYEEKSPVYHRLDVNFIREVNKPNGTFRRLSLGVYNLYARQNSTYILHETDTLYDYDTDGPRPALTGIASSVRRFTLYRFIPHISYGFGF